MNRGLTGRYETTVVGGETIRAFIPAPLPPDPPLVTDGSLQGSMAGALLALGRLDGISTLLPDTSLFLYSYVRKEAVLSSQIEGTQSSLSDLMLFELNEVPGAPLDDVTEVSNYVSALEHGVDRMREGFPFSSRLIRELHAKLLASGRGSKSAPGEFRRSQNWIGGTRPGDAHFVPPPHTAIGDCMASLERFVNEPSSSLPAVVQAGLVHAQFETIHPFLDGNGRVGRLLITLMLCQAGVLREPLLYLSLYFKRHRARYYELLDRIRSEGEWETWLAFVLDGVRETADGAVATGQRLTAIFREDRQRIEPTGRRAGSALRVHDALRARPIVSIRHVRDTTGMSFPTAGAAMDVLVELGIARELTGRRRNRLFVYDRYLSILNEGTEAA